MPCSQKVIGRAVNKKCLFRETRTVTENEPNCCTVRNVYGDCDGDDDDDGCAKFKVGAILALFSPCPGRL